MKKWIIVLLLLLGVAYFTKPDDKTCIIEGTRAVWGDLVPDVNDKPAMFEQFMNVISTNVVVKDWIFFKQVRYKIKTEQRTIAFGAFKTVFTTVKPMRTKNAIPKMPGRS